MKKILSLILLLSFLTFGFSPPQSFEFNKATSANDFKLAVGLGWVEGFSSVSKFGSNPDIDTDTDPEDIWDVGGIYTYSATANITQLSSSNNGDTQSILITGLDENWLEVTQYKTLTGQTPAVLDTPLIRSYRMINMGATDIAGDVYLSITGATLVTGVPDTLTEIRAKITNGNNQTLMCIYTVPAGKTALFIAGYVAFSRGQQTGTANFSWRARPFGGVFQVKSIIGLASTASSVWTYYYGVPLMIPEKTDIVIRCDEVSASNSAVSGGFDFILVDN